MGDNTLYSRSGHNDDKQSQPDILNKPLFKDDPLKPLNNFSNVSGQSKNLIMVKDEKEEKEAYIK